METNLEDIYACWKTTYNAKYASADLSKPSQQALDAIIYQMNIRSCKRFGFKYPTNVIIEVMGMHSGAPIPTR